MTSISNLLLLLLLPPDRSCNEKTNATPAAVAERGLSMRCDWRAPTSGKNPKEAALFAAADKLPHWPSRLRICLVKCALPLHACIVVLYLISCQLNVSVVVRIQTQSATSFSGLLRCGKCIESHREKKLQAASAAPTTVKFHATLRRQNMCCLGFSCVPFFRRFASFRVIHVILLCTWETERY